MIADPSHFIQRVVEEALGQSRTTPGVRPSDAEGEALLAQFLGERLAGLLAPTPPDADAGAATDAAALLAHYDELLACNQRLAGALGACDCWGEDETCPVCHGAGGPGWCAPDRRLFEMYVSPALRAMRRSHAHPPIGSSH